MVVPTSRDRQRSAERSNPPYLRQLFGRHRRQAYCL